MTDIISLQKSSRRVKLVQHKTPMNTLPLIITNPALKPSLKKNVHHSFKPTVTKSVHFDIQLEYIQHFYSLPPFDEDEQTFNIEEEEEDDDDDDDDDDEENKLEDEFLELFWNNKFHSTPSSKPSKQHGTISLPNWPSIHPTRRFISQMVSLESIVWDDTKSVAQGSVLVHNISFAKKVTIRYTTDNWKTYQDIEAVYKEAAFDNSNINNSALDRFEFYISLSGSATCSLAVRYETNRQEFWDNNNTQNFTIQLTSKKLTEQGGYLPSRLHELYLAASHEFKQNSSKPSFHHDVLLMKNSATPYLSI